MKVHVTFTVDAPEGTNPQRVVDVANQALDDSADDGLLVQWGEWGYTPAVLLMVTR